MPPISSRTWVRPWTGRSVNRCSEHLSLSTVNLTGSQGLGEREASRQRRTSNSCLDASLPPGPSRWAVQHHCAGKRLPKSHPRSGGLFRTRRPENRVANSHQYRQHRDVDRFECSSGSVRSLKATAFFVALRLLTLPGERATQTGHNPSQRRNIGFNDGQTLANNWGCPSSSGCNPSACMRFGERAMSFSRKGTRGTFLARATSL